jgi:hypothetical protein
MKPKTMPAAAVIPTQSARFPVTNPITIPIDQHNQNGTATLSTMA